MDLDASQIASVAEVNRNTVNRYLMGLRQRIAAQGHEPPLSHGTGAGTAPVPGPGAARSSLVCGLALVGGPHPHRTGGLQRLHAAARPGTGRRPGRGPGPGSGPGRLRGPGGAAKPGPVALAAGRERAGQGSGLPRRHPGQLLELCPVPAEPVPGAAQGAAALAPQGMRVPLQQPGRGSLQAACWGSCARRPCSRPGRENDQGRDRMVPGRGPCSVARAFGPPAGPAEAVVSRCRLSPRCRCGRR